MQKLPNRGRDKLSPSKFSLVNNYNKYMGRVHRNDALIGNYTCVCKTFKWTVKVDLIHQKICMSTLQLVETSWNLFLQQKRNKIPRKDALSVQKKECARKVGTNVKAVQITVVCVLLRVLSCIIIDLYIDIKKHEHSFVISLFQVNCNVFISFWKRNILPKNTAIFIFLIYPWPQD